MPTLRALCMLLCCMAVLWPQVVIAQQASRVPRIGFLMPGSQESYARYLAAFVQGLRELGKLENRDYFLDPRWADGQLDRLPLLATELVDRKIDVLVVSSAGAAIAARNATTTLPIVQASGGDPVLSGLAASLRDPKGNLTGISNLAEDLSAKSLEQLLHMVPGVTRVGVLVNPLNKVHQRRLDEVQRAASMFHVEVHPVMASPATLDQAMAALGHEDIGALVVLSDGTFLTHRHRIIEGVAKAGLPAIYQIREFVLDGGLMSYGINIAANYRRSAAFVDRILKGAKPADLPIEHPARIELVVNMRTAKELGRAVPASVIGRADEVIE
jgi:putative ABC transport system substrate-binding protein